MAGMSAMQIGLSYFLYQQLHKPPNNANGYNEQQEEDCGC